MSTITVTFIGLCMHIAPGFQPTEVLDDAKEMPTAECKACNKKWIFNIEKRKFIEQ